MASRLRVYRGGQIFNLDLVPKAPWPQPAGGGATYVRRVLTSPPPVLELGKVRGGSAGLVLALAYVDVLTVGDLTGHRLIAATGALGPGGSVDPVLAYDAKVDASARAGANFFLMPRADIPTVEPFARGRTNLVGVSSVKEAVLWLCANGGMSSVCAR
jgi:PDZ domain-containing secreted protein